MIGALVFLALTWVACLVGGRRSLVCLLEECLVCWHEALLVY